MFAFSATRKSRKRSLTANLSHAWKYIISGDPRKKSRFHDENGNFVDWREFKHLPENMHGKRAGSDYYDLAGRPDGYFHFAIIDGSFRWKCVEAVLPKLADHGYIYLDNSDADKDSHQYERRGAKKLAQSILLEEAQNKSGQVEYFHSLTVGNLGSHEGMLVRL